jgi:hypothetical protein
MKGAFMNMMNRWNTRTYMIAILMAAMTSASAHAMEKYDILMAGYYKGPSVSGTIGLANLFENVPIGAEIDLGYSWTPAGDGTLARRVFINDNTGGDEDEQSSGGVLDFGMNAVYPLNQTYGPVKFFAFGGPRYSHYDVRWDYVGGDEDFDIVANSWGLGGGLRGIMPLGKGFSAVMQLGVDYYFPTSIYGHDATYYPNDSNVNARTNNQGYTYRYADAVSATTVPHLRPRVMVGIKF